MRGEGWPVGGCGRYRTREDCHFPCSLKITQNLDLQFVESVCGRVGRLEGGGGGGEVVVGESDGGRKRRWFRTEWVASAEESRKRTRDMAHPCTGVFGRVGNPSS